MMVCIIMKFSVGAGILLLEELVVTFEMDGLRLIVGAVQQRLTEANQAKAQGRAGWWKVRTSDCPSL